MKYLYSNIKLLKVLCKELTSDVHFVVVANSCLTLLDPMDCSTPGFPVLHYLLVFAQTHVHWVTDAIQSLHPLSPPSPAFSLSQHQGLCQWVGFSHQVAQVLEIYVEDWESFSSRDDMGCTEHSSTCSTEIDDPLYLRRLSQGVSRGS